jgi:hypothetical protein
MLAERERDTSSIVGGVGGGRGAFDVGRMACFLEMNNTDLLLFTFIILCLY